MGAGVRDAFPPPSVCVDCLRVSFGWLMSLGRIVCKRLISFGWDAWKNMMKIGRGGACVPARVALQGRIHHSFPCTMRVFLVWKRRCADVRAGTQAPPLRFCLGRLRMGRLISFGVNCAWTEFCLYGIAWKNMMEMGRGGACVPARVAPQGRIHRSSPR